MSATNTPTMMGAGDKSYDEVRKGWHAAHVRPLWENPIAHKTRDGGPRPHLWKWDNGWTLRHSVWHEENR